MAEDRLRLFVAVRVPEPVLTTLQTAAEPLRRELPGGRWVDVSNQHITVKFLGWVDGHRLVDVGKVVAETAAIHAPATLSLGELGSFPSPTRVRVLWAGIVDEESLLARVAADLDRRLAPLGFEPESRPYRPHLTLARFREPVRVTKPLSVTLAEGRPWPVTSLELFRSHLSPRGAQYELLATAPLNRP